MKWRTVPKRVSPFAFKQDRSAQQPDLKSRAAGAEAEDRNDERAEQIAQAQKEPKEGRT